MMRRRTISWVSLRVASCCTMGKESMNELSTAWGNLSTNFSAPASGSMCSDTPSELACYVAN